MAAVVAGAEVEVALGTGAEVGKVGKGAEVRVAAAAGVERTEVKQGIEPGAHDYLP
jgi:hypothetical protein